MTRSVILPIFAVSALLLAHCSSGGGGAESSQQGAAGFVGSWSMLTENGQDVTELGFQSVILDLTETTFQSTMTAAGFQCVLSGPLTYTSSAITITFAQSGGLCPPVVGSSQTGSWSVSGNQLTLKWRGAVQSAQVYRRL